MILFTILALTLIILLVITVVMVSVGGSFAIILFGDVIVCIFIIGWIIKKLYFKRG